MEGFDIERDETGLVRAACWRLCSMKHSYTYTTLCEGWGSVVERRGGGNDDDDRKSVGVADEGIANVVDGDCNVGSKMTGGSQRADTALPRTWSDLQTHSLRLHFYPQIRSLHVCKATFSLFSIIRQELVINSSALW